MEGTPLQIVQTLLWFSEEMNYTTTFLKPHFDYEGNRVKQCYVTHDILN